MATLPQGKAAGPDGLPYAVWSMMMDEAPRTFSDLFNACKGQGRLMPSAREANIIVLAKARDAYACSMYRPISLTNTDYKIIMRVWANRLGPILGKIIGGHQLGFIPGRDGRENVLNLQILMDWCSHHNQAGAALFLDLMKAFDRVSHKALERIMTHAGWPPEFIRVVRGMYSSNTAQVIVNGVSSPGFEVRSGTRQGCPLSPLLFTLIGEVLSQNILKHPNFKGIEYGKHTKKVASYADDTAILTSTTEDIEIFKEIARDFEAATAMKVNISKSEAVLLGEWVNDPPGNIPYAVKDRVTYLGCEVGHITKEDLKRTYAEMEAKISATYARWSRAGTAVKDRVLIAKTMALSKLWYQASVVPWGEDSLRRIQKKTARYIWSDKPSKVAWSRLIRPKKKGGMGMWCLVAKVRAANAMWGFNLETNRLSPDLKCLLKYFVNRKCCLPADPRAAPLLHSGSLPGEWIMQNVGSKSLGYLLDNWNRVAYRCPAIGESSLVYWAHEDGEFWPGIGVVNGKGDENHTFKVTFLAFDRTDGATTIPGIGNDIYDSDSEEADRPQEEDTVWTCEANSLYKCSIQDPNKQYRHFAGYVDEGKTYLEYSKKPKFMDLKGALAPVSIKSMKHGPSFDTIQVNKFVYKAQLLCLGVRDKGNPPKKNRWREEVPKKAIRKTMMANWASPCASNIQSFRWLLLNHALPVGDRMHPKDPCPACNEPESIKHALYGCSFAWEVWRCVRRKWSEVIREVASLDNDGVVVVPPGRGFWSTVCRGSKGTSYPDIWTIVQSITAYHIWRTRCSAKYNADAHLTPQPEKEVEFVWKHVILTLRAARSSLSDTKWWWVKRATRLTPMQQKKVSEVVLQPIDKDLGVLESFISCILPEDAVETEEEELGASNLALTPRNRFSDPYWYEALTGA